MAIIRYHSVQLEEKYNCKQSIKSELQGMLKDTSTVKLHDYGSYVLCGTCCVCLTVTRRSLPVSADSTTCLTKLFFCTMAQQPLVGQGVLIDQDSWSHSDTPHSDFSGRVTIPTQRPLPDNTQHSQQTDIHAADGIRTHNPSKRAAADPVLRLRGGWVRHPTF